MPSGCMAIAERIRARICARVEPTATQPGKSGTYAPNEPNRLYRRWRGHRLYPKRGVIRSQRRYDAERPSKFAGAFTQPAVLRGSALWNVAVVARSTIGLGLRTAHERSEELLAGVGLGARRCGRVQHVPLRVDAAFGQTRRAPGIVHAAGAWRSTAMCGSGASHAASAGSRSSASGQALRGPARRNRKRGRVRQHLGEARNENLANLRFGH